VISVHLRLLGFGKSASRTDAGRDGDRRLSLATPAMVATLLDQLSGELERLSPGGVPAGVDAERLLIIVNGRNVHHLQGLDTPLADGDRIAIMPPLLGG
jgi:molybdopterin synthase sulfur carrier subunit